MRNVIFFVCLSGMLYILLAESAPSTAQPDEGIYFEYLVLPPELSESDLSVSGDTVTFTIFYVDADCGGGYEYLFEKIPRELVIKRTLLPDSECSRENHSLYGVKGMLAGVPKGIYRFTLMTENAEGFDVIFSEPIQIR